MILQGQTIITKRGTKYIHEVKMEDFVMGTSGKWVPLVGLSKRKLSPNIFKVTSVEVEGELASIQFTNDHHVRTYRDNKIQFVCVEDLNEDDYLLTPRVGSTGDKGQQISSDMAWFLGSYSSKGGLCIENGEVFVNFWYAGNTPVDVIKKTCQTAGNLGASKANAQFNSSLEKYQVVINGESLVQVLFDLFHTNGSIIPSKFPYEFHEWAIEQKTEFLTGILNANSNRIQGSRQSWLSHSLDLSLNYCLLASSLGINIKHQMDLWDYSGVIDSRKEPMRDDEFIYKKVKCAATKEICVEKMGYNLMVDEEDSCCMGTLLVGTL